MVVRRLISNSEIPYIVKVQDVTGSRAPVTVYTNNTGRTLIATVTWRFETIVVNDKAWALSWVNGNNVCYTGMSPGTFGAAVVGIIYLSAVIFVPPGNTYHITHSVAGGGNVNMVKWIEAY